MSSSDCVDMSTGDEAETKPARKDSKVSNESVVEEPDIEKPSSPDSVDMNSSVEEAEKKPKAAAIEEPDIEKPSSPDSVDMNSSVEDAETKPNTKVHAVSEIEEKPCSPENVDMNSSVEEVETEPVSEETSAAVKSKTELKRKNIATSSLEAESLKKSKTEVQETAPEQISKHAAKALPVQPEHAEVADHKNPDSTQKDQSEDATGIAKEPISKLDHIPTADLSPSTKKLQKHEEMKPENQEIKSDEKGKLFEKANTQESQEAAKSSLVATKPVHTSCTADAKLISSENPCSDKDVKDTSSKMKEIVPESGQYDKIFASVPPNPPSPKRIASVFRTDEDMEPSKQESETSDDSDRIKPPVRRTGPTAAMMKRESLSKFRTDSSDSDNIATGLSKRTQASPRNPKKSADIVPKTSMKLQKIEAELEGSDETIADPSLGVSVPEIDDSVGYTADMEESSNTSTTRSDDSNPALSEFSEGETILMSVVPIAKADASVKMTPGGKRKDQEVPQCELKTQSHAYPDLAQLSLHRSEGTEDDSKLVDTEENGNIIMHGPSSSFAVIESAPVPEETAKGTGSDKKSTGYERQRTDSPNIFDPEYIKFMERCKKTPPKAFTSPKGKEFAYASDSCLEVKVDNPEVEKEESETSGKDYDSESTEVTSLASDLLAVSGYSSITGTSTSSDPLAGPSHSSDSLPGTMMRNVSEFIPDYNEDSSQFVEDATFPCISDDSLTSSKECLEPPTDVRLIELYIRIAEARSKCSRKSCKFPRQELITEFMNILSSDKSVPFQSSDIHKISVMIGPAVSEFDVNLTAQEDSSTEEDTNSPKNLESSDRTG